MGTTAARKARMILDNSEKVLSIELFAAAQAITFRDEDQAGPGDKGGLRPGAQRGRSRLTRTSLCTMKWSNVTKWSSQDGSLKPLKPFVGS